MSELRVRVVWFGLTFLAAAISGCVANSSLDGEESNNDQPAVTDEVGTVRSALCEARDCNSACPPIRVPGFPGTPGLRIPNTACIAACEAQNAICRESSNPTSIVDLTLNWTHNGVHSKDGDWLLARQRARCDQGRTDLENAKRQAFPNHTITSTPVDILEFRVDGTKTHNDFIDGSSFKAWGVLRCRYSVTASPEPIPPPPVSCNRLAVCGSQDCLGCHPMNLVHSTSGD